MVLQILSFLNKEAKDSFISGKRALSSTNSIRFFIKDDWLLLRKKTFVLMGYGTILSYACNINKYQEDN